MQELEIFADGERARVSPPGGYRTARTERASNMTPKGDTWQ